MVYSVLSSVLYDKSNISMKLSQHFSRSEFACKCGCGFDTVDVELLRLLEEIREKYNQPITINSGCRCSNHNAAVGGSNNSQHLYGRAADIVVKQVLPEMAHAFIESKYSDKYGLGVYKSWLHIDSRSNGPARWDKR